MITRLYEAPTAPLYCGRAIENAGAMLGARTLLSLLKCCHQRHHTPIQVPRLIGYFKLPSVHHYLIIDPDAVRPSRIISRLRRWNRLSGRTVTIRHASGFDPPGLAIDRVSEFFE